MLSPRVRQSSLPSAWSVAAKYKYAPKLVRKEGFDPWEPVKISSSLMVPAVVPSEYYNIFHSNKMQTSENKDAVKSQTCSPKLIASTI